MIPGRGLITIQNTMAWNARYAAPNRNKPRRISGILSELTMDSVLALCRNKSVANPIHKSKTKTAVTIVNVTFVLGDSVRVLPLTMI
jgi:hypothetical protein